MRQVYYNGKFVPESDAKISIFDSALMFGDMVFEKPHLNIPHPLLKERLFVLKPWNDIAPNFLVPKINLTVNSLYENLIEMDNLKLVTDKFLTKQKNWAFT